MATTSQPVVGDLGRNQVRERNDKIRVTKQKKRKIGIKQKEKCFTSLVGDNASKYYVACLVNGSFMLAMYDSGIYFAEIESCLNANNV